MFVGSPSSAHLRPPRPTKRPAPPRRRGRMQKQQLQLLLLHGRHSNKGRQRLQLPRRRRRPRTESVVTSSIRLINRINSRFQLHWQWRPCPLRFNPIDCYSREHSPSLSLKPRRRNSRQRLQEATYERVSSSSTPVTAILTRSSVSEIRNIGPVTYATLHFNPTRRHASMSAIVREIRTHRSSPLLLFGVPMDDPLATRHRS